MSKKNITQSQALLPVSIWHAHLGMLGWVLLVGLSFPAVGLLSEGLPPLLLTAMRFTIAALALLPLLRSEDELWPGWAGLVMYALMGLCLAGFFGTMFWAAHRVTALTMATMFVSVPLLAYGLGRLVGVERRAGGLLALLTLGACGALALAWADAGGDVSRLNAGSAEALFFVGCIATALYPVLTKLGLAKGVLSARAGVRTLWSLALGAVLVAGLALLIESPGELKRLTRYDVFLIIYLGLFSSGLTFWLQQRATAVLSPAGVTAYGYLVPFVSMLVLFINFPQRISLIWLPGSLLVVLCIVLLLRRDVLMR
ncbi:DMT family transporter [Halomonas halocynthiae]|uniref:DMT family transporter n=1 Tax=Halomonas halocynthiae TaxID=176290 RepID=UPI00040C3951|nr:DMT family transporter [Halomonas halocynthiae]